MKGAIPSPGERAELKKAFTKEEVEAFAKVCGDDNPIHVDEAYARESVFGRTVVHGALVASLFSGIMGSRLPGWGSVYLGQTLKFTAPVFVGEEVTASAEVVHVRQDKPIVTLRTLVTKADGTVAIEGEAVIKAPI